MSDFSNLGMWRPYLPIQISVPTKKILGLLIFYSYYVARIFMIKPIRVRLNHRLGSRMKGMYEISRVFILLNWLPLMEFALFIGFYLTFSFRSQLDPHIYIIVGIREAELCLKCFSLVCCVVEVCCDGRE